MITQDWNGEHTFMNIFSPYILSGVSLVFVIYVIYGQLIIYIYIYINSFTFLFAIPGYGKILFKPNPLRVLSTYLSFINITSLGVPLMIMLFTTF